MEIIMKGGVAPEAVSTWSPNNTPPLFILTSSQSISLQGCWPNIAPSSSSTVLLPMEREHSTWTKRESGKACLFRYVNVQLNILSLLKYRKVPSSYCYPLLPFKCSWEFESWLLVTGFPYCPFCPLWVAWGAGGQMDEVRLYIRWETNMLGFRGEREGAGLQKCGFWWLREPPCRKSYAEPALAALWTFSCCEYAAAYTE
jgi:hypothetical protein